MRKLNVNIPVFAYNATRQSTFKLRVSSSSELTSDSQ